MSAGDRERKRWARLRTMGRARYVLVHGVLKMGVALAVLMALTHYGLNAARGIAMGGFWHGAGRFAFTMVCFGVMSGWWEWRVRERRFLAKEGGG